MNAPATASQEPRWGLGDAVLGWLIAYSSLALIGTIIVAAAGYGDTPQEDLPITMVALSYPPLWLGFVGVPFVVARQKGFGWVRDFGLRVAWKDLAAIPVGVLTQWPIVPLVSWPLVELAGKSMKDLGEHATELADKAQGSPLGVVLLFLIVVIGAPIAEEIFFRGLVLRAFEKRFGTVVAVIASSVVFGATHFQWLQFPALTVAGLVFAILTVKSGRLGPAILAHAAFNAVTVVNLVWFA